MRIRWAEATGCPVGQFVVEAENDQDRAILSHFGSLAHDPEWVFWMHGRCWKSELVGVSSFNFGYIKKETPVKRETVHSLAIPTFQARRRK